MKDRKSLKHNNLKKAGLFNFNADRIQDSLFIVSLTVAARQQIGFTHYGSHTVLYCNAASMDQRLNNTIGFRPKCQRFRFALLQVFNVFLRIYHQIGL